MRQWRCSTILEIICTLVFWNAVRSLHVVVLPNGGITLPLGGFITHSSSCTICTVCASMSFICMQGSVREQFICHMKADWRVIAKWACSSHGAIYSSCLLVCFRKCQLAACELLGVSTCLCVCATRCRVVVQQFAVNHMQYIFQRKTEDVLTRHRPCSVSHGLTSCLSFYKTNKILLTLWAASG